MDLPGRVGEGLTAAFTHLAQHTTLPASTFTVSKSNVLAAAQIIQNQAEALDDKLRDARRDLRIDAPGGDDVSTRIALAWNDILLQDSNSYANRIQQYIDGLRTLAQQCADSAKAYGFTDEQIAAALGGQVA